MSKYTKGPWEVDKGGNFVYIWQQGKRANPSTRKAGHIATLAMDFEDSPQSRMADARLISAAPELLKACKFALDNERALPASISNQILIDKINKAIAKVENKS